MGRGKRWNQQEGDQTCPNTSVEVWSVEIKSLRLIREEPSVLQGWQFI